MFAIMALGGDIGCVMGPAIVGFISNVVESNKWIRLQELFTDILPVELGFKAGLSSLVIYHVVMILILLYLHNLTSRSEKI